MGRFVYENNYRAEFDDRVLAHLQAVVTSKLRRGEPFTFTWKEDMSVGAGRTMVWLHPGSSIVFKFTGGRRVPLNKAWLDALSEAANGASGLTVVPEPTGGAD